MKNRFQNVPFKCNVHRYTEAFLDCHLSCSNPAGLIDGLAKAKAGLYKLNPVDP